MGIGPSKSLDDYLSFIGAQLCGVDGSRLHVAGASVPEVVSVRGLSETAAAAYLGMSTGSRSRKSIGSQR